MCPLYHISIVGLCERPSAFINQLLILLNHVCSSSWNPLGFTGIFWPWKVLSYVLRCGVWCILMAFRRGSLIHKDRMMRKWVMGYETVWHLLSYWGDTKSWVFFFIYYLKKIKWFKEIKMQLYGLFWLWGSRVQLLEEGGGLWWLLALQQPSASVVSIIAEGDWLSVTYSNLAP